MDRVVGGLKGLGDSLVITALAIDLIRLIYG
jgi:hypothetical protein